jgi:hypothetical protein
MDKNTNDTEIINLGKIIRLILLPLVKEVSKTPFDEWLRDRVIKEKDAEVQAFLERFYTDETGLPSPLQDYAEEDLEVLLKR